MICSVLAMEMLQGVWKQHLRPRAVVGYGVKIFLPNPPNYVTRSPGVFAMPNACGACWRSSGDEINVKMVALKTASGFLGQCSKSGGEYFMVHRNGVSRHSKLYGRLQHHINYWLPTSLMSI